MYERKPRSSASGSGADALEVLEHVLVDAQGDRLLRHWEHELGIVPEVVGKVRQLLFDAGVGDPDALAYVVRPRENRSVIDVSGLALAGPESTWLESSRSYRT